MSGLDKFMPPSAGKPHVEERCAKCRKLFHKTDTTYKLTVKGKEGTYCQACAKVILRPQEKAEEI